MHWHGGDGLRLMHKLQLDFDQCNLHTRMGVFHQLLFGIPQTPTSRLGPHMR